MLFRSKRGGTSCSAHELALTPARRNPRTACSDCVRHDIDWSRCCLLSIVLFLSSSNRLFSRRSRALGMLHEHHWLRRCRSLYVLIRYTYRYACVSLLQCYCIVLCFANSRAQSAFASQRTATRKYTCLGSPPNSIPDDGHESPSSVFPGSDGPAPALSACCTNITGSADAEVSTY